MSDKSSLVVTALIFGGLWYLATANDEPETSKYDDVLAHYDTAKPVEVPSYLKSVPPPANIPPVDIPDYSSGSFSSSPTVPSKPFGTDSGSYSYGAGSTYGQVRPEFNEDDARDSAEREMRLRGYDFRYGCTIDCSGHEAGWQYRGDTGFDTYGIIDGYGRSQSFGEGARAFEEAVEDRVEEMRDDYDLGIDYPY